MPTGPNCLSVINACRLRVALLDDSGAPDAGADSMAVSDSLIRISYQMEVSQGQRIEVKNGCGTVCATKQEEDRIVGVNLTIELCHLDIELIALMTGASLIEHEGRGNVGTAIPPIDSDITRRVSIEAWAQAWDGDEQATDTTGGTELLHWRFIFPSTSWTEGDREMTNAFTRIILNGRGRSNANFGNGPGNDLPWGAYVTPKGEYLDDNDLPTATCGTSTLVAS